MFVCLFVCLSPSLVVSAITMEVSSEITMGASTVPFSVSQSRDVDPLPYLQNTSQ